MKYNTQWQKHRFEGLNVMDKYAIEWQQLTNVKLCNEAND